MNPAVPGSMPAVLRKHIAVAGNPNSGKTTIFNALTGLRMKVANYPGVTVEKREGFLRDGGDVLLDLPGVYSLSARAPDEAVARDVLLGRVPGVRRPDGVLIVVDASNLERNLYLATQIIEFGIPAVVALNMMDAVEARGERIDCDALAEALGVPVVPTVANRGRGISELRGALAKLDHAGGPRPVWSLPPPLEQAVAQIAAVMESTGAVAPRACRAGALLWIIDYLSGSDACRKSAEAFLRRIDAEAGNELRRAAAALDEALPDAASAAIESRYGYVADIAARAASADGRLESAGEAAGGAVTRAGTPAHRRASQAAEKRPSPSTPTDRIDGVLTHRFFGPLIFAGVMFVLFLSIFSWAEPLMDAIEAGQNALSGWVGGLLAEGPLRSLLTDGVIAGIGAVVVFFPQIAILFFCLALLEDTGYMARAAFLMDRLMSRVGLHGKSFIPLLSSYACAIPGILATRTIENRRDRFATIMVAPFMSCSARLPVYIIVIGAVFGDRTWLKAGVMFAMYALGTVTALAMALVFKKTLFAGPRPAFIMELPPYRMPRPVALFRTAWTGSKSFLTNAGTVIFAVCVLIWAASYFPRTPMEDFPSEVRAELDRLGPDAAARRNLIASIQQQNSYIGRMGHAIEPVLRPLGFDWRLGAGILSSFLAREVFVGTMGITFAVGEADEQSIALREKLASATWPDGSRVMTPLVGVGLMVFYVLACQCISTLAVVRKETGSWRWPTLMFAYMTVLAYAASLAIHQIGTQLGLG